MNRNNRYNHTIKVIDSAHGLAFHYEGENGSYTSTRLTPIFNTSARFHVETKHEKDIRLSCRTTGGHADFNYWSLTINDEQPLNDIAREAYGQGDMSVRYPSELYASLFQAGDEIHISNDSFETLDKTFTDMAQSRFGFYNFSDHKTIADTFGPAHISIKPKI
jgi:cystathionine beta-lyase/cystathionine gamma-synthase